MSDPSNAHSGIGALLTPQNSEFVINLKTDRGAWPLGYRPRCSRLPMM
jgi:hypothetical protein